ncbi:MFS transporter [Streptomyces sp. NBC_01615]|uniref:MFS transporter n=1 Tax=Streptomyces sp. NBC_01615 TaxID=2975898 RepID=UPI003867C96E
MTTTPTPHAPRTELPPAFRLFWAADAVSLVGDALRGITVILWLYSASGGSARAVSVGVLSEHLPALLAAPAMGSARRPLRPQEDHRQQLRRPRGRLLPQPVPRELLVRANSNMTTTTQVSYVVGPFIGAALFERHGPAVALTVDAASFLLPALLQGQLSLPRTGQKSALRAADGSPDGIRAGLRALFNHHEPALALGCYLYAALQAGINNTVLVAFLPTALHRPSSDVALFSLANGIAQILIAGLLIGLAKRLAPASAVSWSAGVTMVGGLLLATSSGLGTALAGVVIVALATAPLGIGCTTLRQTTVPESVQGRATGIIGTLTGAVFLLASLTGAWLADATSPRTSLACAAGALTLGALLGALTAPVRAIR